ncbi:MAG: D-glycero-beta-D-manno-heptose-7-phosphate kinase [Candidatus Electryonea clarkiae]|nr:D-glycero-beta-D-manno-heptose-7-phosphate kinase [Candidatus Electryonea clarkiae]MDP8288856.1 D-glycero-beta-D-manno-heptose-7-phosphate kinase [Candidatus Electryonea clarkiae]
MPSKETVKKALDAFNDLNIIVIGDLMLDRYIWGKVSRISPEAPVPVVDVNEEAERPGGAGNVVLNLTSVGAKCVPIGIIGDDLDGAALTDQLAIHGATITGVVCAENRPTTVKTRIIADNQHVVRIDHESVDQISPTVETALLERIEKVISSADAIILQDYNKGVMTKRVIHGAIELAKSNNIPVTVDPKFNNFFEYRGATVFKPNLKEAESALGRPLSNDQAIDRASGELLARLQVDQVLLTRGSDGMTLYRMGKEMVHIPTQAQQIHDVSGAGDTVISILTLAIAAGIAPDESARLANASAGYVVGEVGVVPITREALLTMHED